MKPKHLLALGVLLVGITAAASLTGAQKSAPPQPSELQKLKEHVDALEAQLKEANAKADRAAMEKEYIERIQKEAKDYYDKVLSTQTWTLGIVGLIITIISAATARFGLTIFDRHIEQAVSKATTDLETKFDKKLADELQTLKGSNAAQMKQLEGNLQEEISTMGENLDIRGKLSSWSLQGIAMLLAQQDADALDNYRKALNYYVRGKARSLFSLKAGAPIIANLLTALRRLNPNQFQEAAKNELASPLYDDLEDELKHLALEIDWLGPLVKERKQTAPAPDKTQPAEPD